MNEAPTRLFFPIAGIHVLLEEGEIGLPFLGNVSLMTIDEAVRLVTSLPFADDPDEKRNAQFSLRAAVDCKHLEHPCGLIVVHGNTTNTDEISNEWTHQARSVTAALMVVFLVRFSFKATCAQYRDVKPVDYQSVLAYNESAGEILDHSEITSRAPQISIPDPPLTLPSAAFKKMLDDEPVRDYTAIMLYGSSQVDSDVSKALETASWVLYESVQSDHPLLQLLGAISSIEVLLSKGQSKYKEIKNRLHMLLGPDAYRADKASIDELFKFRNEAIHEGAMIDWPQSHAAIKLATAAIVAFARAARQYDSRDAILTALDTGSYPTWDAVGHSEHPSDLCAHAQGFAPDLLAFGLTAYALNMSRLPELDSDERALRFAYLTAAMSRIRGIPLPMAFQIMRRAAIGFALPFDSIVDLEQFIGLHEAAVSAGADATIRVHQRRPWSFE